MGVAIWIGAVERAVEKWVKSGVLLGAGLWRTLWGKLGIEGVIFEGIFWTF